MFKEGIHPKVVQEILGHASITQTLDTYSHVIPSMQEEVADKINLLLGEYVECFSYHWRVYLVFAYDY